MNTINENTIGDLFLKIKKLWGRKAEMTKKKEWEHIEISVTKKIKKLIYEKFCIIFHIVVPSHPQTILETILKTTTSFPSFDYINYFLIIFLHLYNYFTFFPYPTNMD
jgi:hypothetical protein